MQHFMAIFYPESKRIKIAASEADFEAGELWGRKASAAFENAIKIGRYFRKRISTLLVTLISFS